MHNDENEGGSEASRVVAFLVNAQLVQCPACATETLKQYGSASVTLTRVYRVNIGQYSQSCHTCGLLVVSPANEKWPELWPAEVPLPIMDRQKVGVTC